jgi:hypothetical protein
MSNSGFIFQQWETRAPFYALMKLEEEKICALETTWAATRSKGIRVAMSATFGGGWHSVIKEAGKQSLKYGGRKALGAITGLVCAYFGSASIVLLTNSGKVIKCAKICHSVCSGGLDVAELCATTPVHALEIVIFGRPVLLKDGKGFDLFASGKTDPISDVASLLDK